ncbi:TMV resistance protein N-like [Prunus avium]|uniref:TMV resistance protein N-like n=1 Tax=Prunus avium TaxID=42229 RepID=A0A6P5RCL5_PRUAV|nr:TMV resistance protein N-like [Prunus avium]
MVGIWGIGGIGKTTIARAVYNTIAHKFEGSCFLDNVREESMQHGGLVKLQNIILSKILGGKDLELSNVHEGMNVIKKRVLIIVDDANQVDQLKKLVGRSEWFGNGSRIIITTRDKHLLTAHQVNLIYNVKELDDHEAFDLFSANAFPGERRLSDDYKKLASTVVQYARGLPLALVVLGSLLCCGSIEERLDALDGCKKIPNPDIQEALKISYNSLEDHVKEVFLDIACFFKGEDKDHLIQILEGCGLNPKYGVKVLKEKALINVNEICQKYKS